LFANFDVLSEEIAKKISYDMMTDISQLIQRALQGDQKACAEIVERFHARIYNFVFRMVKNKAEAEDLTQETFIKAFNALSSFNSEYAFSTWLYKIAVNNTIDYFRKKRLRTFSIDTPIQVKDGDLQREFEDTNLGPEHGLISQEKSLQIKNAIDSLPEKYREAILLRHTMDRSYEEISEELDVPLGTVKVRIFRAREMLKKKLREQMRS
jgi:RNA polymerase sigma factor (sigma-70 family)